LRTPPWGKINKKNTKENKDLKIILKPVFIKNILVLSYYWGYLSYQILI